MSRFGNPSRVHERTSWGGPLQGDPGIDPDRPCKYPPGSMERVLTLRARVDANRRLWHKDDAKFVTPYEGFVEDVLSSDPDWMLLFGEE